MNTTSALALDLNDRASAARPRGRLCTLRAVPQPEPPPRDIPTVRAYADERTGFLRFWCGYCDKWHFHGHGEGHRAVHCFNEKSPYIQTGYNLKLVGTWKEHPPGKRTIRRTGEAIPFDGGHTP